MRISVNGTDRTIQPGVTVSGLLDALQLQPVRVAVEINEELVSRRRFDQTSLQDGDHVEIVTFVGGG